jgi:predicted phosphate transport protein (TIGR00153 family)
VKDEAGNDRAARRSTALSWLFGRFRLAGTKQKPVVRMILNHLALAADAIAELGPLLDKARVGDWTGLRESARRIGELETRADSLHREAVMSIARGSFFSGTREDFLRLMEADDEIADSVKDATRVLAETPLPPNTAEVLFSEAGFSVPDMVSSITKGVAALGDAIQALETDAKVAIDKSIAVEIAEEETDDIKTKILTRIANRRGELDPLTVLQLRDFVLELDNVADATEDASDVVVELVAKAEA